MLLEIFIYWDIVLYCWNRFIVYFVIIPVVNTCIHISQLLPLSENEIHQIDLMHDSGLMTCFDFEREKKYVLEIFKLLFKKKNYNQQRLKEL